ncbi:alkaline phosphatase family protein [Colwellia sp. RSH04]|uniref:alkaline phosphatase family protein n=1 Tax=Colwellia sp. RSH04 TaxID=2305464 RepID=UPI000E58435A|nr:alkaline phosphatase family protein [Colwellia sp. RSH04]RHW77856.1 phosphoesterase [Colwellia sp. RSH04]
MTEQYLKPNPKALAKIKHIVVLMMENHSFDNMLGWLYEDEKPTNGQFFEGLNNELCNPLNIIDDNGLPFIEQVYARKNGQPPKKGSYGVMHKKHYFEDFCLPNPDPGEGFKDTNQQLFEYFDVANLYPPTPTNKGFVNNYANAMLYGTSVYGDAPSDPRDIMASYTPSQTPVLSKLSKEFAVCDYWFCSVPSQTLPNRDFVHAATSTGYVNNKPDSDCDAKTIYQQIQDAIDSGRKELSWGIYSGTEYSKDEHAYVPFSLTRTIMSQLQDSQFDQNFKCIKQFYSDAKAGTLPSYTFLEPQFSGENQNDQHPPSDIRAGEQLMADIYDAIVNSPTWQETLFVITYDEHGGCYDHVEPGKAIAPDGEDSKPGQDGFLFNRMGVRVPTVVISPLIDKGCIGRPAGYTPFDHTSLIATAQQCFGLAGSLTARDKAAPDLSCLLTRDNTRKDKPTVTPLPYKKEQVKQDSENDLQQLAATVLGKISGVSRADKEHIHDYIHRAYDHRFDSKK